MEPKKIKVATHAYKESLIKGGRGAGDAIIEKGEVEESELIFRITLPKDDEEAMRHWKIRLTITLLEQELSVLKSWIKLGASFDMMIMDEAGRKAAEHVLKNLPEKKLSATVLIPKLPEVSPADISIIEKFRDSGLLVMPIAQNTNALYVNVYKGKSFNDESIDCFSQAPQLLWLNVARTAITDKATESLNFSLERLHAENTQLTDAATPNISKLENLKYLNLMVPLFLMPPLKIYES